jgi:NAD(P)-dependent dehydrogenase (short-subunit alcohol dehydrogenase family)
MTLSSSPARRFAGSVTVITGAGSGIGRALALALGRRGALMVCTDVDATSATETRDLVAAAGGQAWDMVLDVTQSGDHAAVRDFCLGRWGRVDRVVNNAGVVALGLPQNLTVDVWRRSIDINLLGLVRGNEVFVPVFLEQGSGHLVNTASTSGLFPYSFDRTAYVATKAAVVALTESLALYLRPQGIDVSCVCPAGVRTGMPKRQAHYMRKHVTGWLTAAPPPCGLSGVAARRWTFSQPGRSDRCLGATLYGPGRRR